jgi:4-amino-4-deoxy-L-arabinose transferase-like glycosyltransferase
MKQITIFIFGLIVLLAAILRFYKITINPPHLYWDEASIAYNAYSLNETGKDEWGKNFPIVFKAFGDYKLPLYIYLTALSQRVFGVTDFAVRLPSAAVGVLTVVVMFFLCRQLKMKLPHCLIASLLMTISPWHWQFSRAGFEANLGLFCQITGLWLFLLSLNRNKWLILPAFIFFAGAIYSYHGAAITTILLIPLLFLVFRQEIRKFWKQVILGIILFCLILAGYLPNYLQAAKGRINLTGENFLQMKGNPIENFTNNYLANFSFDYLFFHGDQDGRHSVKKLGELYLWQLPTVLAGIYFLLRNRTKASTVILIGLLISALPPTVTTISPHALRGLGAVYWWQILSAIGLWFIFRKINPKLRLVAIPVIFYALALYLHVYFIHYPKAYAADWQDGAKQATIFLKKIEKDYENIFVYKDFPAVYLMLYWPIDPKLLQQNNHNTANMGKFTYFDYSNLPRQNIGNKDLLLVPEWFKYDENKLLRQINMYGGDSAYKIYEL